MMCRRFKTQTTLSVQEYSISAKQLFCILFFLTIHVVGLSHQTPPTGIRIFWQIKFSSIESMFFCRTNIFQHLGRLSSRFPWQVFSYYSLCFFSRKNRKIQFSGAINFSIHKPKKSDTRDAGYWWLRLCTVAPAAFCFSWDTLLHIVKWFRLPMHCDRAQYVDSLEKVCGQLFINCS